MCVCKEIVVKSKALYTEDEKYRFLLEKLGTRVYRQ